MGVQSGSSGPAWLKDKLWDLFFLQTNKYYFKRFYKYHLNRIKLARNLNVLSLDQLMFKHISGYLFGILSNQSPSELYSVLLSKAHNNNRSGKVNCLLQGQQISNQQVQHCFNCPQCCSKMELKEEILHGWSCQNNYLNQNYWNVHSHP